MKRRDGLDRRSIEQYVCVISDFRMVAVNETFFVADVRRFSLANARKERLDDGALSEKALKIVGISSLRDASETDVSRFFLVSKSRRENDGAKRKSTKETENAADSTVDATTTRLPLVKRGIVAPS
ncbi:MAG: hypothetical protein IIW01_09790 [Thermoguttaceae bacterium]|nr:hypothetical protein [Thermoguttaceae bacterium]